MHARMRALHPNKKEATVGKLGPPRHIHGGVKYKSLLDCRKEEYECSEQSILYSHFSQCVQIKLFKYWLIGSLLGHDTSPLMHALQNPPGSRPLACGATQSSHAELSLACRPRRRAGRDPCPPMATN
jgi:hypothetical protein